MRNQILLLFVVIVGILLLGGPTFSQSVTAAEEDKTVSLNQFLTIAGNKYRYYFTLESLIEEGHLDKSLEQLPVRTDLESTGIEDLLQRLKQVIPNFSYRIDPLNSKIIYIYDKRLLQLGNYGLEMFVNKFSYDGPSTGLIQALKSEGIPISAIGSGVSTEPVMVNLPDPFHIKNSSAQVRDLLTNSIQLTRSNRLLWIARTDQGSMRPTYVRYD